MYLKKLETITKMTQNIDLNHNGLNGKIQIKDILGKQQYQCP